MDKNIAAEDSWFPPFFARGILIEMSGGFVSNFLDTIKN